MVNERKKLLEHLHHNMVRKVQLLICNSNKIHRRIPVIVYIADALDIGKLNFI